MRDNYYIRTYPSGLAWNLMNPRVEDVHALDIAWSLANTNRYGGHGRVGYSVAQHLVHVHDLIAAEIDDWDPGRLSYEFWAPEGERRPKAKEVVLFHALFHDAHEAYLGDMMGPLKALLQDSATWAGLRFVYNALVERHDEVIFRAFGFDLDRSSPFWSHPVHEADQRALELEMQALGPEAKLSDFDALPGGRVLSPKEAAAAFMDRLSRYVPFALAPAVNFGFDPRFDVPAGD